MSSSLKIENLLTIFTELEARVEAHVRKTASSVSSLPDHVDISLPSTPRDDSHEDTFIAKEAMPQIPESDQSLYEDISRLSKLVTSLKLAIRQVFLTGDLEAISQFSPNSDPKFAAFLVGARYYRQPHVLDINEENKSHESRQEANKCHEPRLDQDINEKPLSREKCMELRKKIKEARQLM